MLKNLFYTSQSHPELNTQGIALSDLMQRAQLGQKHKLSFNSRTPTSKKRIKVESQVPQSFQPQQQQQYMLQQPVTPLKISSTPVKMESDTNSHTSGDYSLHSAEDLKHTVIEQPDQKPPERLLAEEIVKDEPIEMMEQKYEIEPPAAQPPPTLMDEYAFILFLSKILTFTSNLMYRFCKKKKPIYNNLK